MKEKKMLSKCYMYIKFMMKGNKVARIIGNKKTLPKGEFDIKINFYYNVIYS